MPPMHLYIPVFPYSFYFKVRVQGDTFCSFILMDISYRCGRYAKLQEILRNLGQVSKNDLVPTLAILVDPG